MKRRVVITGMGAVTPIGNNVDALWESIQSGTHGIGPITRFDAEIIKTNLAAEIKDLNTEDYLTKQEARKLDLFTQYAIIASKQAYEDAHLPEDLDRNRFGVMLSSGIGGLQTIENSHETLINRGAARVSPHFIPMCLTNLAAGNVAIALQAKGICTSVVTACAAGANAIGDAFRTIRDGYMDVMVAGGAEASITPLGMAGFASMRATSEATDPNRASIPFDAERNGFVMGEGAGAIIMETLESAQARGAKIYGEIVGYGATCDAYHITAPESTGDGAMRSMQMALDDAKIDTSCIDYINAHGTSTPLNDKTETKAIRGVFGADADKLAVSSTKSMTGHLLGASGAVEAIISLKALANSFVPPTANFQTGDPECDLDIVPNQGRKQELNYAMSNSLGFGGHNATLIFKKWEGESA